MLTRTSRSLRTVRTGYAYQPPAYVPEAQGSCCAMVRTSCAYQPRVCRTYRVPWHPRRQRLHRQGVECRLDPDPDPDPDSHPGPDPGH
eukprot:scaffold132402_cov57-Phaeocystis_antarctica.AAC.2